MDRNAGHLEKSKKTVNVVHLRESYFDELMGRIFIRTHKSKREDIIDSQKNFLNAQALRTR